MEPLDTEAQERVVQGILAYELVAMALFAAGHFTPALPLFDVGAPAQTVHLGAVVQAMAVGAGLAAVLMQAHYVMRFMWARGQFLNVLQDHFDEHSSYFLVGWLVPIIGLLLAGGVWVLSSVL
ncbi:MAG: hypothetical protein AB7O98_14440 [Hyphomonadaceae bacterium]